MSFYQQQPGTNTSGIYQRRSTTNVQEQPTRSSVYGPYSGNAERAPRSNNNSQSASQQQQESPYAQWTGNSTMNQQQQQIPAAPHSGNRISMGTNSSSMPDQTSSYNPSQQIPQQQQNAQPQLWNPALFNTLKNDAVQEMLYDGSRQFIVSGMARMVPGLETFLTSLRVYFAVDNQYVSKKIQRVLLPFMKKDWKRMEGQGQHGKGGYALPRFDENAPDLYLPVMSLITYVLLCAFLFGSKGEFTPEALPDITQRCFVTQILEVIFIWFGHYMMQVPANALDLFCFTGYKYCGLCVNMMAGLAFGYWWFYATMVWTGSASAFFMFRTMAHNIPRVTASNGPKREVMVIAFAVSQALAMWWISQTKLLDV